MKKSFFVGLALFITVINGSNALADETVAPKACICKCGEKYGYYEPNQLGCFDLSLPGHEQECVDEEGNVQKLKECRPAPRPISKTTQAPSSASSITLDEVLALIENR